MAPIVGTSKGIKRKAGGNGKKGKVFVEDKKDLLSLMSSITSSKDNIAEKKISKRKAILNEENQLITEGKKEKSKKTIEKEAALERAKTTLIEKQRLKKIKKSSSSAILDKNEPSIDIPKKKKVGFA
ncbi:uncharacterized protein I206_102465 [Kwoniella pini CBS 10737]|uniref:Uncharacterized protein n=1 Tax=Kwoniella pini CBS 10737 TaxID=1296096 RepID=A0A1B9I5G1_9TREE|nr:uncharacterized protein I206_02816 [Kwoniella pini CBS 10737]OCF50760.1 hypothetical protein I206_02816 [Kwoniella pini CBS 10737]